MSGNDASNQIGRSIRPLISLLTHRKLAAVIFLLVLMAGSPLIFIKSKPIYEAATLLQVAPNYMKNLHDDGELNFPSFMHYERFLEHQSSSVLRYDIVREALQSLGERGNIWRLPQDTEQTAVNRLRNAMTVRTPPNTYMIELSLKSENKEGIDEIVNAVARVYLERMKVERIFGVDERAKTLELRENQLLKSIQEKVDRRTQLTLKLGISGFTDNIDNPYDKLLTEMRSNLAEARLKRVEAESRLKAFVTHGEADNYSRSIQEAVSVDPGLSSLKSVLYKRRANLLTQLSGLEPKHPAYPELNDELKKIEVEIATQTSNLTAKLSSNLIARYQSTLDQARRIEQNQAKELDQQIANGLSFANNYNQAITLTQDIDQERKELDSVRERLNQFAVEKNAFGFVRLVSLAMPAENASGTGKKKLLLMLIIVATFASVLTPTVVDLFDRRIHTVNDAERALGIPSLGWMIEQKDEPSRMIGEDLMRRVAAGLIRENLRRGTAVFAFSSVKPGAGTTETVMSLAMTLNQLGYPTLAVEANAFNPDMRFHSKRPGLQQCLNEQSSPQDCVVPADKNHPPRVMVGTPKEHRHLDSFDQIDRVLQSWLKTYQFVLVDIPPLLLSADAEIFSSRLQQLILVVESHSITSDQLKRAARQLEKIDPSAIGMLVNRVRPFEGGGYLKEMQLEYITGRKLLDYFSLPAWRVNLQVWLEKVLSRTKIKLKV